MSLRTTPTDNTMRLAYLDRTDCLVTYVEGTITSTGITGVSSTTIFTCTGNSSVIYDDDSGAIALACNENGTDYHIVWLQTDPTYDALHQVMYSKSLDGGGTWDSPTEIAITPVDNDSFHSVRIMGDSDGRLFILFQYEDDSEWGNAGYQQVWLYRSTDDGDTWSKIQTWTYAYEFCDIQIDSSDNVYVLYEEFQSPWRVVCRKSTDNGDAFGSEVTVSSFSTTDFKAELDESDNLHVIYADYYRSGNAENPHHVVSTDGGSSFSASHAVETDLNGLWQFPGAVPGFAIDGNDIHFVWGVRVYEDIGYSHSDDSGSTWSEYVDTGFSHNVDYGDELEVYQQGPQRTIYDGSTILYVFGTKYSGALDYLGCMTSGDGGSLWTQSSILAYGKNNHYTPTLATYFITEEAVSNAVVYFFLA